MKRIRVRFSRQERIALRAVGYTRRDLTALRRRILAGPFDPAVLEEGKLSLKEVVGHMVHQNRSPKTDDQVDPDSMEQHAPTRVEMGV